MNKPVIPFIKPSLPSADELSQDISRIKANNYYSNNGPIYYEFKAGIEQYLNTGLHAVVVSNATLGLMMAVSTVFGSKKQEGKRYIAVPSFTFAAAPLAIQWAGYEPLFFDIDKETCQPSLESFKNEVLRGYAESLARVQRVASV